MPITLTVERRVVPGNQGRIKDLLRLLRSRATRQPGFVSGQTVVDAFNPAIFMTVSIWSNMSVWERWEKNSERCEIVDQINTMLQDEPKVRLWSHDEDAPDAAI